MSTFAITTDKSGYAPGEVITVTLSADPMVQSTTITGSAELPNGTKLTDTTTTTITGTYGPVAADGYTAAQTDDPAVWTLTPVPAA